MRFKVLFKNLPNWTTHALIFFAGCLAAGSFAAYYFSDQSSQYTFHEEREGGNYKFINPLLECDISENYLEKSGIFKPSEKPIQDFIGKKISAGQTTHVSVYFRDLNNGPWFGINENEEFLQASLVKIPIMMVALKMAEKDPAFLEGKITYSGNFQEKAAPPFKQNFFLTVGKTYTIKELIELMIEKSSNSAAQLLLQLIKEDTLKNFYKNIADVDYNEGWIKVKDYASFLRILYNASYLNKDMSELALSILDKVEFKQGLAAGVPASVTVADKFGIITLANQDWQLHDCGIVYYPGHPYLLCIMSRGNDALALADIIRQISQIIYQQMHDFYH